MYVTERNKHDIYSAWRVYFLWMDGRTESLEKQGKHSVPCERQTSDISRATYQVIKTNKTRGWVKRRATLTRHKLIFIQKAYTHSTTPSAYSMNNYSSLVNLPVWTGFTRALLACAWARKWVSHFRARSTMALGWAHAPKAGDIALHYTYTVLYVTRGKSI